MPSQPRLKFSWSCPVTKTTSRPVRRRGRGPAPRFDQPTMRTSTGGVLSKAPGGRAMPAGPPGARSAKHGRSSQFRSPLMSSRRSDRSAPACAEAGTAVPRSTFPEHAQEHIQVDHRPPSACAIRDAMRSIERGMGNTAPKDSFRLHSLDISIDLLESAVSFSHGMVVLGSWFLCCEMELSTLRVKHLVLDPERKQACMTLSASKTDTVRSMVQRRHAFYYGAVPEAICPYHAALRIADQSPSDPEAFLALCTGLGRAAHQDADHRGHPQWRTFHHRPGTPNEPAINRFGGHCLRVSGAQHLCRMRALVSTIMVVGAAGPSNDTCRRPSLRT